MEWHTQPYKNDKYQILVQLVLHCMQSMLHLPIVLNSQLHLGQVMMLLFETQPWFVMGPWHRHMFTCDEVEWNK